MFENIQKGKFFQIVFAVLILVIGFVLGSTLTNKVDYNKGLSEGRRQAEGEWEEKVKKAFPGSFEEVGEIFSISGKILEIGENDLLVEAVFYPASPFEEMKYEKKIVKLGDDTEITIYGKETSQEPIVEEGSMFLPLEEISGSFSDFKVGDEIFIESDENIKDKTEFFAKKIILQSIPSEE